MNDLYEEKLGISGITVKFGDVDMLEWREFITKFDHRQHWLEAAFKYNLSEEVIYKFIKPRLPDQAPRTQDTNIFAPKGMGKSYLLLLFKEVHHNTFDEEFDWNSWFMSPTQFLMYTEQAKEADISNKFLAIDEPKVRERGEGSGALHERFMNTRSTIRPRRSVIAQASERIVHTNPNLVIKPVFLDEERNSLMSLVLSPSMLDCYGSMYSGLPSKKVCKIYDEKRLVFEKRVREDVSEIRAYWEPIAYRQIEQYGYTKKYEDIRTYKDELNIWAINKANKIQTVKPTKPPFMNAAFELSETRITQDARYYKKLGSTEYKFLSKLIQDILEADFEKNSGAEN